MDWATVKEAAEAFNLWSSVVINAWLLLTAVALIVSRALNGKLSSNDVLVVGGLMIALVGIAAVVAIGWVVLFASVFQALFGPPPVWLLGLFWAVATGFFFWFYWAYTPRKS